MQFLYNLVVLFQLFSFAFPILLIVVLSGWGEQRPRIRWLIALYSVQCLAVVSLAVLSLATGDPTQNHETLNAVGSAGSAFKIAIDAALLVVVWKIRRDLTASDRWHKAIRHVSLLYLIGVPLSFVLVYGPVLRNMIPG
ncbi:hypothetical protein [Celeribacter sp. SCSIO 80788]|uniref:hypothetical protein n=1 Tax=Celeribacter sp. SCSIO 80788 TaxID=3117013 RepID=UPI003DA66513